MRALKEKQFQNLLKILLSISALWWKSVRRANLTKFCGDDVNRLRPVCVQTYREDGGQNLKMWQMRPRAEAPRQRQKRREPRPEFVCQSTWIWLRTGSIYGIPVNHNPTHTWFMCRNDGAKTSIWSKTCRSMIDDRSITAVRYGLHPGNRYSLSPGKDSSGTRESYPIQQKQLSCGWDESRRCHSSPGTGKPFTWRRTPARPIEP